MRYPLLGSTGLRVSTLCYGAMSFGGDADEDTSAALFVRCREAGINFFDCADVYASGRSESILGRLAAPCRDELVLVSKAYFPTNRDDPTARGASRRHLMLSVEQSLRRLGTDRIDLFFVHRFDENAALDDTLRALDDLVRQGKVVYTGASNFAAWQVAKALGISLREGWARFACIQPMYNLVKRQAEVELLPMAQSEGLGVTTYSPLAGGLLTGKYAGGARPAVGRFLENEMYKRRYGAGWVHEAADRFVRLARDHGVAPATLAIAWVASHPAVTAPIIGARNVEQLEEALAAAELVLSDELRSAVSALVPEPPPATDRSDERGRDDPMAVTIKPAAR